MKVQKPISGVIRHPTLVLGGTQHGVASSFTPTKLQEYEKRRAYRDQGLVWVCPSRGMIHTPVVVSWLSLQWPVNQFRSPLIVAEGAEISAAYNWLFESSMNKRRLRQAFQADFADMFADAPFILTTEEDNVIPSDAIPKLLSAMFTCPDCGKTVDSKSWQCERGHHGYDAIGALYFMKTDPPSPMAFGTPNGHKRLEFRPRSVEAAVKKGSVIEVNGIAQGCSIFRKDLLRRVSKPWFKSEPGWTQDLWFCNKAKKEVGARFGVHCGVKVAHYDPHTRQFF